MSAHRFEVRTEDGWTLDVLRIPATRPLRGAVLLGHAMMVDRRSMDRPEGAGLASFLAASGWEVFLPDFRGRGDSGPSCSEGGSWSYDEIIRFDLPACLRAVRQQLPDAFVWLVGHSLAGHASIAAAGSGFYDEPPDGHVLLSVNTWLPSLEPSWWRRRQKASAILVFAVLKFCFGRFPSRLLRFGPVDEAGPYVGDLVRTWRQDRWGSRDGEHDYLAGMASVGGPILSVLGRGDRLLAHPAGARNWAEGFGAGRFELRVVGAGDFGLDFDPDHMTLVTDARSGSVWHSVCEWMDEKVDLI